jgi:hypothetical protein
MKRQRPGQEFNSVAMDKHVPPAGKDEQFKPVGDLAVIPGTHAPCARTALW